MALGESQLRDSSHSGNVDTPVSGVVAIRAIAGAVGMAMAIAIGLWCWAHFVKRQRLCGEVREGGVVADELFEFVMRLLYHLSAEPLQSESMAGKTHSRMHAWR